MKMTECPGLKGDPRREGQRNRETGDSKNKAKTNFFKAPKTIFSQGIYIGREEIRQVGFSM